MPKTNTKSTAASNNGEFKLPRYLRLAKGSMWFDDISGVKLYSSIEKFVGRGKINEKVVKGELVADISQPEVKKDKYNNNNFVDYGWVPMSNDEFKWYVDVETIPPEKRTRLVLAYKHKILVEADPNDPPKELNPAEYSKDFEYNKQGDLVFVGKNKEVFLKLQNLNFEQLKKFIESCPKTEAGRNNLIDMHHYELRGFNKLYRPRHEVLELIKNKLKEFGSSISGIRINEDE